MMDGFPLPQVLTCFRSLVSRTGVELLAGRSPGHMFVLLTSEPIWSLNDRAASSDRLQEKVIFAPGTSGGAISSSSPPHDPQRPIRGLGRPGLALSAGASCESEPLQSASNMWEAHNWRNNYKTLQQSTECFCSSGQFSIIWSAAAAAEAAACATSPGRKAAMPLI